MLIRIRQEMAEKENHLLEGMVGFNETNVGGKPRKHGQPKGKRGRGTNKIPAIGAIEGGGKVVIKILSRVTIYEIEQFELSYVKLGKPKIITDEYKGYIWLDDSYHHAVIKHIETCSDGDAHTQNIASFWAIVKRVSYGVYHRYSGKYMPLYITEACYRHNHRSAKD